MSRWHPTWATPIWAAWLMLGATVQWAAMRHGPTSAKLSRHVEAARTHPVARIPSLTLAGWLAAHWYLYPRVARGWRGRLAPEIAAAGLAATYAHLTRRTVTPLWEDPP